MSGRFPRARDIDEFWAMLLAGQDAMITLSDSELLANGAQPALLRQPGYVRTAPVLADIDQFDAGFFGFTPDYARVLDPQHRLFLEQCWHALEDAGHDPRQFDGLIGAFAGSDVSSYLFSNLMGRPDVLAGIDPLQIGLANDKDALATRVGYLLDLRGPCFSVQSYCSTSLVAVCTAATSLVHGECDIALAGGVSVTVPQGVGYLYQDNGMISPDGRCRAFDADADGTPMGSGAGVVVLRRLADAIADGDRIRAVIRGWAITNDGGLKVGFTAPGVRGQSAVVADAIAAAAVEASTIDYIEAHGTGTPLGDSVEIAALQRVFPGGTRCAIGSVKTNIGHLNHASGVTGLIKTVLSLEHAMIPATVNFSEPNPQLLQHDVLTVVTEATPWPVTDHPARAGVSSFGIGGTNAHVVLEQAPPGRPRPAPLRQHHALIWSARTDSALRELTGSLRDYFTGAPSEPLGDVAFTLQAGRAAFEHRRCLVTASAGHAATALADPARGGVLTSVQASVDRPVGLLIAGVGEQYQGMVARLYVNEPEFRDRLDASRAALRDLTGTDPVAAFVANRVPPAGQVLDLRALTGRANRDASPAPELTRTEIVQPALFAVWYALAGTLEAWGIRPAIMLGYSLGEYVAACLAGVLSFEDALAAVWQRAELISRTPAGAMAAVGLSEDDTRAAIETAGLPLDIAGVNAPSITVVAGAAEPLDELVATLAARQVVSRRLETSHAFHSRLLATARDDLTAWFGQHVVLRKPDIPYVSNVTGQVMSAQDATDPAYWARHMCSTVRFADGVTALLASRDYILLEIGTGSSLGSMVRAHPSCDPQRWSSIIATLPAAADPRPDDAVLADAIARLWLSGASADWPAYHSRHDARRVRLPRYPFARERHWVDAKSGAETATGTDQNVVAGPGHHDTAAEDGQAASRQPAASARTWLRAPVWRPKPVDVAPQAGHVLACVDDLDIAGTLRRVLGVDGTTVTIVRQGEALARDDRDWTVRPGAADDLAEVIGGLDRPPTAVVHLWAIDPSQDPGVRALGLESLAAVAHAVGSSQLDAMRLLVVTVNAEAVFDDDEPVPEGALITGAALAAGQEYPGLAVQRIDLPRRGSATWTEKCAQAIRTEAYQRSAEPLVAYRGSQRLTRSFELRAAKSQAPVTARAGGVYLVTGGRGKIGQLLAVHLARQGAAAVVLAGRSAFPDRGDWDQISRETPAGMAGELIGSVRAAEAAGATIVLEQADAADREAMGRVIASIKERFSRLDGVIHLAASNAPEGFATLATIERRTTDTQFAPKVDGALVLEQLLADEPIDFCLMFSSISSILGGIGFAAYASANAFLDSIVYRNRTAGRPWLAVDWDTWEHTAAGLPTSGLGASQAENSFSARDGLALLDAAMELRAIRVVAGVGDLDERLRAWSAAADTAAAPVANRRPRPDLGQEFVPPASRLERRLAAIWGETIGIDGAGAHDNFFDLGGTSLAGLQMLRKIRREVGVAIPAVALFEAPTIAALASYIAPQLKAKSAAAPAVSGQEPRVAGARTAGPVPAAAAPAGVVAASAAATADGDHAFRRADGSDCIAVIGMAGRFPGAASPDELWSKLITGTELIRFFTDEELLEAGVYPPHLKDDNYVKARPVLDDIRGFDAAFFGYSPKEAALTDPQQRLFLECCWEALEHAGYGVPGRRGRVGVFGGTNMSTYMLWGRSLLITDRDVDAFKIVIGNDKDALATVASYRLDLTGPSMSVQTFCSTSLVAVHLACHSLRAGECELALAGGVSIQVPDKIGYHWEPGRMEAPDGHVRSFDAKASGTLFGDAAATVVLKPLAAARRDGDTVFAVIRGSATNNDGARRVGYTAPGVTGQARVVADALADAGVKAEEVAFVEAHATATELGDPIEVTALSRAFDTPRRQYCALVSIKPNVGHLDRAAGATGLIKTALALHHRVLPPNIYFDEPNPEIDFANSPFFVNTELMPLRAEPGHHLIAGVSSLGMGGTNAHVIVQEAPPLPVRPDVPARSRRMMIVPVSGRSAAAADTACLNLAARLEASPELDVRDVAWTMQVGRQRFRHRRAAVVHSLGEATAMLTSAGSAQSRLLARSETMQDRRVAFVFGSAQPPVPGLLAELASREPAVGKALGSIRGVASDLAGIDVAGLLTEGVAADADAQATAGVVADIASFVTVWATATLLRAWGVAPAAVLGTGAGEIAAACVAGVLTPEHALSAVAERTSLLASCDHSDPAALARAGDAFAAWLGANVILSDPRLPFVPAVATAAAVSTTAFWRDHIAAGGRLREAMEAASEEDDLAFLAFGPGDVAAVMAAAEHACQGSVAVTAALPVDGSVPDDVAMTAALAELWLAGVAIDWATVAADIAKGKPWRPRRIPLPTYPFERADHWLQSMATPEQAPPAAATAGGETSGELARLPVKQWLHVPLWQQGVLPRAKPTPARWLVFTDDDIPREFFDELVSRLEPVEAVQVRPGTAFTEQPDGYTIRPGSAADIGALLAAVGDDGIERVLHLWNAVPAVGDIGDEKLRGFHALIGLASAMADLGHDTWHLDVVVSGAFHVVPGDTVAPARALTVGPVRIIPLEYPKVRARLIDLGQEQATRGLAARLARELAAPAADQAVTVAALRGDTRWTIGYDRVPPAEPDPQPVATAFADHGVYLVTGGLGGIGLAMAERLARDYHARLVLFGRTGLPHREDWPGLLAGEGLDADLRRRIEGVQAIEASGGEAEIVSGDVSSQDDAAAAVQRAVGRFGRLDGVLHAAGLPGVGLMQFKSRDQTESVLAPKVAGTLAIERAIEGHDVGVLVLFSSITSVTGGGPGQVDYCSANAFLDAYARDATARGIAGRVVAIDWGEWTWNAWSEGLHGYGQGQQEFFNQNRAKFGIEFEEGWQAMRAVLACGEPHVIVSTQDFTEFARYSDLFNVDVVKGLSGVPAEARFPRPELSVPFVEPRTETETVIASLWAEALGLESVGVLDRFFELGGNSIIGVDIVARIRQRFDLAQLPPHVLYEAPTVEAFAAYVTAGAIADDGGEAQRRSRAARRQAVFSRTRGGDQ
jgi:acyl transferase domain-containing protein/acyl carrier protein